MEPTRRRFEAQVFILLKRHGKKKTDKVFAIAELMRCLLQLMEVERMRGWTLEGLEPGPTRSTSLTPPFGLIAILDLTQTYVV